MSEEKNISESKTADDIPQSTGDSRQLNEENVQPVKIPELLSHDSDEQMPISKSLPKESFGQTPETMEVHHHGHVHEKKKWKEYVFQFLMLFLAVFCGFLAEYQLEHKIERERETELAASFYNELKGDSVNIQTTIANRLRKDAALNYLKRYFRDSSLTTTSKLFSINFLYAFATYSPSVFEPNDAILNQLKNSGSLRYFKDAKLQDLTGKLSVSISNLKNRNAMEWTFVHETVNPFYIKHNDPSSIDIVSKDSGVYSFVALQEYEKTGGAIPFSFQNMDKLDAVEAANIVGLYQLQFRGTLRKQYQDYVLLNAQLLSVLREIYKLNSTP